MSAAGGESDAIIAIREKLKLKAAELGDDAIEEEEKEEVKDIRRRLREILLGSKDEDYENCKLREIARINRYKKEIRLENLNENQVIESDAIIAIREKLRGNKVDETKLKAAELGDDAIEEDDKEEVKDIGRRLRERLLESDEEYENWKSREIARIKRNEKDIRLGKLSMNQVIELVIRDMTEDEISTVSRNLNRLKKWSTREMYYSKEGFFLPDENPKTAVVFPPPQRM